VWDKSLGQPLLMRRLLRREKRGWKDLTCEWQI
jgi:hypothetical protein